MNNNNDAFIFITTIAIGLIAIFTLVIGAGMIFAIIKVGGVALNTFSTIYPFLLLVLVIIFSSLVSGALKSNKAIKSKSQSPVFYVLSLAGIGLVAMNQGFLKSSAIMNLALDDVPVQALSYTTKTYSPIAIIFAGLAFILLMFTMATAGKNRGKGASAVLLPLILILGLSAVIFVGIGSSRNCADGSNNCEVQVSVFEVTTVGKVSNSWPPEYLFGCLDLDISSDDVTPQGFLPDTPGQINDVEVCVTLSDNRWSDTECQKVGDLAQVSVPPLLHRTKPFEITTKAFGAEGGAPRTYKRTITARSKSDSSCVEQSVRDIVVR